MKFNILTEKVLFRSTLALFLLGAAAGCQKKQLSDDGQVGTSGKQTSHILVNPGLIMGINGHPLNTYEYNANSSTIAGVDYTTQANMVKAMGMTYYRIDISTKDDGTANNEAKMLDVIAKCQANNIKVLPMIGDKTDFALTQTENYNKAFTQMAGFATKYGQYFDYFELGNEWELFRSLYVTKPAPHQGQDSTDYNMSKVRIAEQYVKGMEAGLKSVWPNKQSMVNTAGYFPTFWMDRMLAAAPTINICGWHLYASMPAALQSNLGVSNIHQYLYNRYHRPIWYTESGYKASIAKTQQENEDASDAWRVTLTSQATADPNVKAIIFYELLDRPQRTDGTTGYDYGEENYGWVKFNNYPGKTDPVAWNAWKANPDRYQDWSYKKPAAELVGPDLIVTEVSWSPASPHTGDLVTFTCVIKNVGVAATTEGTIVGVSFKVDGNSAGCNGSSTVSLAPGASRTLTANGCSPSKWTAVVGTHSVVAKVDDQNRFKESDETNNTRTESVVVIN
ncbi:MAG: hypothetical protein JWN56_881 [Sphingobacteriales bacterium]|nr:hypothetical protein [Sphingobacteriales bacterium]